MSVPSIAMLIGSANDKQLVRDSGMYDIFATVGVEVPLHVISAHRNAAALDRFCRENTVDIYIAAAGLAAALPGAIAANTEFRKVVIGVPLDQYGIDTCIRLPAGVACLTPGVGKAGLKNAAIAACQIAALQSPEIAAGLDRYLEASARPAEFDATLPS